LREDVQSWLKNWFVSRAKITQQTSDPFHIDYFAAGWLTSMEVVEFVTDIEAQFNMQFTDHDLQDSRFVTMAGLTELILERSTQMSESR
jgi:acyl carrier protein